MGYRKPYRKGVKGILNKKNLSRQVVRLGNYEVWKRINQMNGVWKNKTIIVNIHEKPVTQIKNFKGTLQKERQGWFYPALKLMSHKTNLNRHMCTCIIRTRFL